MKKHPLYSRSIGAKARRSRRDAFEALDQTLRQPVPEVDDALCRRILDAAERAPNTTSTPAADRAESWLRPWTAVALGGLAATCFLVWMTTRSAPTDQTAMGGEAPGRERLLTSPPSSLDSAQVVAKQETDRLVRDSREIAGFLRTRLRL